MVILEIEYEANIEKVLFFVSHSLTFRDQNPAETPNWIIGCWFFCNVLSSYWIKIRNIMKLFYITSAYFW